jgi:replicative DNA helicase
MSGPAPTVWEYPIPLDGPPPPAFPTDVLPSGLREMVESIAAAYQVPADLPALLALGCLSAAVAGKSRVRVGPDWKEELCAYVGCLLPSGERKSPVVREIAAPLEAWERAALANERERVIALEQERVIVEKRLAYARERAARESGVERLAAEKEVHDLALQLERLDQPVVSRLLADDATPEALVSLLADHGGRIAVISAEGGLFDILAGRYSNGAPNLDAVLKAYGCESIRVDRKGRDPARRAREHRLSARPSRPRTPRPLLVRSPTQRVGPASV